MAIADDAGVATIKRGMPRSNQRMDTGGSSSGSFLNAGFRALSNSWPRQLFSRLLGGTMMTRNFYQVFGWDRKISAQSLWEMYHRGGIAKRIVHAFPDAIYGNPPKVEATKAFSKAWDDLQETYPVWPVMHRLERLANIGQYAVLLVGTNASNLETPMKPGEKISFLQAYGDRSARISKWVTNPSDPRFCLPEMYTIYPQLARIEDQAPGTISAVQPVPIQSSFRVHWSRLIHVAQGQLENELFGIPILWSIWNYLTDLQKVIGASSESYWNTANRGMQMDLDPEMELDEESAADLNREVEEYFDGQRRFIRTRGIKVNSLGSDVADPAGPFRALITLISGSTGIPQRILVGSESSHQASTQDKGAWAERVMQHRELVSTPYFLKPFLEKMMELGALPTVKWSKVNVEWPDAYVPSPLEKAQEANQNATAANNMALAVTAVPNMLAVEEIRVMLQLPPDMPDGATKPEVSAAQKLAQDNADKNQANLENGLTGGAKGADGGVPKSGNGSGNSSPGNTSDANGSGDAQTPRK